MPSIAHTACLIGLALAVVAAPAPVQNEGQGGQGGQGGQDQQARQAPGRIEIDRTEHDFGDRLAEDPAVTDYVPVRNVGEGPLTITAVSTSCGCVVGKMREAEDGEPVVIQPGEASDLELRLNPAGWSGNKPTIITVRSDDPQTPEVRIRMKANVTSAIRLDPSPVSFGERPKGETQEVILKVAGRSDDFEVYAATVAGTRAFEVEALDTEQIERDGEMVGETSIKVTLLPNIPVGEHRGIISLRTTDRARRLHSVEVGATVTGDLEFDVPRIAAGAVEIGDSVTRTIRLTNRAGESFRILEIQEQDEEGRKLGDVKANVTRLPEDEGANGEREVGYEVELTIDADRPQPGGLSGSIIFITDLPLEEKARIRYLGRILPEGALAEREQRQQRGQQ